MNSPSVVESDASIDTYTKLAIKTFEDAITSQIASTVQDSVKKDRYGAIAQEYAKIVYALCSVVFSIIKGSEPQDTAAIVLGPSAKVALTHKEYFHLLEHMHCALEELGFPPPTEFSEHFARIGFRVLSRKLFIHYVCREVFHLNAVLVQEIIDTVDSQSPDDAAFRGFLVSQLHDNIQQLERMECNEEFFPQLLDYYHQVVHQAFSSSSTILDDAASMLTSYTSELDNSASGEPQFAPLSYFLISLSLALKQRSSTPPYHENNFIRNRAANILAKTTPFCLNPTPQLPVEEALPTATMSPNARPHHSPSSSANVGSKR